MSVKTVGIMAAVALFLAIFNLPIGYYSLLRWIVCGCAFYYTAKFYDAKVTGWAVIFLGIGIVFNPIFPVYLTKAGWAPIDFISAVLFLIPLGKKRKI